MLRKQPKPKERRTVSIPHELRDSLREAYEIIRAAKNDPDISIDFDDAIQTPHLCGGKTGEKPRPFQFTYYHSENDRTANWQLALHRLEIEDIADGRMTEMSLYCCTSPGCGHKSRDSEDLCDCDYFEDPNYGTIDFPAARDVLAHWGVSGIDESSGQSDVIEQLGKPSQAGGDEVRTFGYIWPWIKYLRTDCQLRFEFNKTRERLRNISVMDADWEPGK